MIEKGLLVTTKFLLMKLVRIYTLKYGQINIVMNQLEFEAIDLKYLERKTHSTSITAT